MRNWRVWRFLRRTWSWADHADTARAIYEFVVLYWPSAKAIIAGAMTAGGAIWLALGQIPLWAVIPLGVATGVLVLLAIEYFWERRERPAIAAPGAPVTAHQPQLALTYDESGSSVHDDGAASRRRVGVVNSSSVSIADVFVTMDAISGPEPTRFLPLPLTPMHGEQPFTLHPGETRYVDVVVYEDEIGDFPDHFILRYAPQRQRVPNLIPVSRRPYSLTLSAHGKDVPARTRCFGLDLAIDRTLLFWPQKSPTDPLPTSLSERRLPDDQNPAPQFTDDPEKRRLARLLRLSGQQGDARRVATENAAEQEAVPITTRWLTDELIKLGYYRKQLSDDLPGDERQAGRCLDSLHGYGIKSRSAATAFFSDRTTSRIVEQLYLEELPLTRKPQNVRDAVGLCAWGPPIYRAASPDERTRAIEWARLGIASCRISEEHDELHDAESYADAVAVLRRTIDVAHRAFWELLEDRTDPKLIRLARASATSINEWQRRASSKLPDTVLALVREMIVKCVECASQYGEYAKYEQKNDYRKHDAWRRATDAWGAVWGRSGLEEQVAAAIKDHETRATRQA